MVTRKGADVDGSDNLDAGAGDPWLLPVGHYGGIHFDPEQDPPQHHQVRLGGELVTLTDEEFMVWTCAHGDREILDQNVRWTRAITVDTAAGTGVDRPDRVIASMLRRGTLTEVADEVTAIRQFGLLHRLVPLTVGLGNTSAALDQYEVGLFQTPLLTLPAEIYQLWSRAHLDRNLVRAAKRFAGSDLARTAAETLTAEDPAAPRLHPTDPDWILVYALTRMHLLVTANVAYLDRALAPRETTFVSTASSGQTTTDQP